MIECSTSKTLDYAFLSVFIKGGKLRSARYGSTTLRICKNITIMTLSFIFIIYHYFHTFIFYIVGKVIILQSLKLRIKIMVLNQFQDISEAFLDKNSFASDLVGEISMGNKYLKN